MDRRAFIEKFTRLSILSILIAIAGIALFKRKNAVADSNHVNKACGSCLALSTCNLPHKEKINCNGR